MTNRLFLLKLCATLSAMICGGCQPLVSVNPPPAHQPNHRPMELKITIDGEGKINVGGEASLTAKAASESAPQTRCNCGGSQEGCSCSRGQNSAASTVGTSAGSGPQFVTQYRLQQVCKPNGQCDWVRVPVQVPLSMNGGQTSTASVPKRSASAATHGGRITVYVGGSQACLAMQRDLADRDDIDFVTGTPPEINGNRWHPTAVKPDGSRWSPARAGWDANSVRLFDEWRRGE